jgi:hypothetical protein
MFTVIALEFVGLVSAIFVHCIFDKDPVDCFAPGCDSCFDSAEEMNLEVG